MKRDATKSTTVMCDKKVYVEFRKAVARVNGNVSYGMIKRTVSEALRIHTEFLNSKEV